ncbi:MAG: tyrosine-protein phosphatase [Gammaproteobacteria bacterium]|jgi:protein tyrosine/serine phosphatase
MNDAPAPMSPLRRARAYWHALVHEHGWVRILLTTNFHAITPRAFRSGQLPPWTLRRRIRKHGLRTVVNLRGPVRSPALELEREICQQEGARYLEIRLFSRDTHRPEVLLEVKRMLETIEYPALFHCMSGADRAGFMATLYLHWIEGVPLDRTRQLRLWPYWHYRYARTGLMDYFFETYLKAYRERGISLEQWIREEYTQESIREGFHSRKWLDWIVDRLLKRE